MKKKYLLITLILIQFIFQSCKKEIIELKPINKLEKFSKVETQIFKLDTLDYKKIIGKKGTIIYYDRYDFDIKKNDKVVFKLKELYDFEDLLFNNIRTITDKNELLESSGVIFIEFSVNGKKINLKKNKRIQIKFPENKLNDNNIYSAKIDSINQFNWKEEKRDSLGVALVYLGGGITKEIIVPIDSLQYYKEKFTKDYKDSSYRNQLFNESFKRLNSTIFTDKIGWINIDKIIDNISKTSFELDLTNKEFDNLFFIFLYDNSFSFMSDFRTKNDLVFKDVPFIKNITSLMVFGFDNDKIYLHKVRLEQNPKSKIYIQLKKTDKNGILELLK